MAWNRNASAKHHLGVLDYPKLLAVSVPIAALLLLEWNAFLRGNESRLRGDSGRGKEAMGGTEKALGMTDATLASESIHFEQDGGNTSDSPILPSLNSNSRNHAVSPSLENLERHNSSLNSSLVNYYKPRKFFPHASYGFIQYSAYRFSPGQIAIIGLGPSHLRQSQSIHSCTWFARNGDNVPGHLNYTFNVEMQRKDTEELIACNLDKPTGNGGGYLVAKINFEDRIVYEEEPGMLQSGEEPFAINHTYCSAPLHGTINSRAVFEWMEYHRVVVEIDNFIFYHIDPLNQTFLDLVQPYLDSEILKLNHLQNLHLFDVWYYGQVLSYLDCMYRVALTSRWVFLHDLDEYLHAVPPNTLPSLLSKHKAKAWMTHGMMQFNPKNCMNQTGNDGFSIERMVFREPSIYCVSEKLDKNFCTGWRGHRKLIVNPRKVFFARVHSVDYPKDNGVDFNTSSELRHYHFRQILVQPSSACCSRIMNSGDGWWILDRSLAATAQSIKAKPISSPVSVSNA